VSDCHFEYGTSPTYEQSAPCAPSPGAGAAPVAVTAALAALSAHTTYHRRIVATNAGGTSQSADQTFTTLPEAPAVQTEGASAVTQTTATLHAGVSPNEGEVSDCHFEYGSSVFYEASQPCGQGSIAGGAPVEVSGALMGLTPQTTYHFRIVA